MDKVGSFNVGSVIEAQREEGEEWEAATIKSFDANTGTLNLTFEGGFVAQRVPMASVRYPDLETENRAAYQAEITPTLPAVLTAEVLQTEPDAKYGFIAGYKDAGNALFKQGRFDWAIRTYCDGVDALAGCYASRERMIWDFEARVPCAQCYSNAALCALKSGNFSQAEVMCGFAMSCRPEDADLVKVLLRHGQAMLGLGRPEEARELLYRAAEKEPNNRPVREELVKAKKAVGAPPISTQGSGGLNLGLSAWPTHPLWKQTVVWDRR